MGVSKTDFLRRRVVSILKLPSSPSGKFLLVIAGEVSHVDSMRLSKERQ